MLFQTKSALAATLTALIVISAGVTTVAQDALPAYAAESLAGTGSCAQSVSQVANVSVTQSGNDCIITFTGSSDWTVPHTVSSLGVLAIGGGGGGAADGGPGGGGGESRYSSSYSANLSSGNTVKVTVGAGGGSQADGSPSRIDFQGDNSFEFTANGGQGSYGWTSSINSDNGYGGTGGTGGVGYNGGNGGNGPNADSQGTAYGRPGIIGADGAAFSIRGSTEYFGGGGGGGNAGIYYSNYGEAVNGTSTGARGGLGGGGAGAYIAAKNSSVTFTYGISSVGSGPTTSSLIAKCTSGDYLGMTMGFSGLNGYGGGGGAGGAHGDGCASSIDPWNDGERTAGGAGGSGVVIFRYTLPSQVNFAVSAPSTLSYGSTITPTYSGGAGAGAVSYSVNSGDCSVSGSTIEANSGTGDCEVLATKAASAAYPASTATFQVSLQTTSQSISFSALASKNYGASAFNLNASSDSGLSVSYESNSLTVCSVSGSEVSIVSPGTCSITASQPGDGNYAAATPVTQTFVVSPKPLTINVSISTPKIYDGTTTAEVASAVFNGPSPLVGSDDVIIDTSAISASFANTLAGIGKTVTATFGAGVLSGADAAKYSAVVGTVSAANIDKANQAISFAPLNDKNFGDPNFTVSATTDSSLTVAFSSDTSAVCTVSGTTVTIVTAGTCTIRASQAGNENYNAATSVARSFIIAKLDQTITFNSLGNKTFNDSDFSVSATTNRSLTVAFSSDTSAVCTVSGTTVTIVAAGTCTIRASQAGTVNYNAAIAMTQSFTVEKANQTLTFGTLSSKTYGDAGFTVSATADSSLTPTFSSTTSLVCSATSAGEVRIVGAGTCTIRASQSGNDNFNPATAVSQSFTVAQASQSQLNITSASTMVYGDTLTLVATGGSGTGTVTFSESSSTCQIGNGNSLTATGTGSCVVSAVRSADTNYLASSTATLTITITAASQSINFLSSVPVSAVTGTTYTPRASSTSGLTVVFDVDSSTAGVCSITSGVVTFASSGSCVITARQSGNANYLAAPSAIQTIVAGKINQTILFPAISNKNFDSAAFLAGASVGSGRTVTYVSATPSICEVNASTGTISIVTIGECTVTASSAGDSSYAAASPVSRTFTIDPVSAGKPSITSVSFSDSSVTVAFVAPSFLGGDSIDGYQLVGTSSSGTVIKPDCGVSSPCTISGLTNGASYTFTIAAINAAGIGPASNASPAITPAAIPDAVSALRTTPGNQQLVVEWDPFTQGQLGGATFTRYDISIRVRSNPWNPPVTVSNANLLDSRSTNSFTFTGLTNGAAYDVKVVVVTSANGSELSSNTSTALGVPATTPSAPQELNVSLLSDSSALVAWSAPLDDGGSSISSYDLSHSCDFIDSSQQSCVVSNLTPGTQQTFAVAAVNQVGRGEILTSSVTVPGLNPEQSSSGSNNSNGGTATSWNYSEWQSEEAMPESLAVTPTSPESVSETKSSEKTSKVASANESQVWIWIVVLVGLLLGTSAAIYFGFKRKS